MTPWDVLGWLLVFLVAVVVLTITVALVRSMFRKPVPPKPDTHPVFGGDK